MPVERRNTSTQIRTIIVSVSLLVLAVGAAFWFIRLASGGDVDVRLGDDVFNAGDAERLAARIESTGPFLFADVSGRGQRRPILVNHVGDGWKNGWVAFDALEPGQDGQCFINPLFIENNPEPVLRGDCTGRDYPLNGEGLQQYTTRVDERGLLVVDLRSPISPSGSTGGSGAAGDSAPTGSGGSGG